jgi:hypothetical protein
VEDFTFSSKSKVAFKLREKPEINDTSLYLYIEYEGLNGGSEWAKLKQWHHFTNLDNGKVRLLLDVREPNILGFYSNDSLKVVERIKRVKVDNCIDIYQNLTGVPVTDTIFIDY